MTQSGIADYYVAERPEFVSFIRQSGPFASAIDIGCAGVAAVRDLRGTPDLYGMLFALDPELAGPGLAVLGHVGRTGGDDAEPAGGAPPPVASPRTMPGP